MKVSALCGALDDLLAGDDRPLAVYSALWPLARATATAPVPLCDALGATLVDVADGRTLLMPTFTHGYVDGVCDLDSEPSTTGVLTEHFRTRPRVRRTRSAFFSFAVSGPDADALVELAPEHAWGDGSLYHWLYDSDAWIVTIGVHPTHCSFSHYAEWLARDVVSYRFEKRFTGTLLHEGERLAFAETLFVRQRAPSPVNDFTPFLDDYLKHGMRMVDLHGIRLSRMSARAKADLLAGRIAADPLAVIANREDFEGAAR